LGKKKATKEVFSKFIWHAKKKRENQRRGEAMMGVEYLQKDRKLRRGTRRSQPTVSGELHPQTRGQVRYASPPAKGLGKER